MNKRVIALLLTGFMMVMPISSLAKADEEGTRELFEFLNIDLIEEGSETLTRGYAAKLYCLTANLGENYGQSSFTDIASSKEAGYIVTAYNFGYITVNDVYTFRPDEPITCYEFARGFVKLLGYRNMAEISGYDYYIASLDLLDGIESDSSATLTKEAAVIILSNALSAPYLVQTVYGSNSEYEKSGERTILSELYHLTEIEGYVTANDVSSIYSSEGVGAGNIQIGSKVYQTEFLRDGILGRYVRAFVTDDDMVRAIFVNGSVNSEYAIWVDKASGTNIEDDYFFWIDDGKTVKKRIEPAASYIYNGCFDVDYAMDMLDDVRYGTITLVDNDNDGKIELVFVDEYTNYSIKGVANGKLFDRHNQPFLDLEDPDIERVSISKNGTEILLKDIEEWNTASVYKSKNNKVIKIEISDNAKFEEITAGYTESGYDIYELTDQEYECAICGNPDYTLSLGKWGKFYFDAYGRISGADLKSDIKNYGFLVGVDKGNSVVTDAKFKILNAIGKYKIFEGKSNIIFNGVKTEEKDVAAAVNGVQLVSYEVNGNNEIISLSTVGEGIKENATDVSGMWRTNSNAFGSKYAVGTDTVIFNIPADLSNINDDDLTVVSPDSLSNTTVYTNLSVYDMDAMNVSGAIVIKGSISRGVDHGIYFITNVRESLNNDGDLINILEYYDGNRTAVLFTDSNIYGEIKKGTGIRITEKNANGDISSYSVEFEGTEEDFSDTYIAGESNQGIGAACVTAMGIIEEVGDGAFSIEGSEYIYISSSRIAVYNYKDARGNYFQPMSLMELAKGDRVFIVKSGDLVVSVVKM